MTRRAAKQRANGLYLFRVRGLVQVPNTRLAVLVRYLQSDQLYCLVLGIAVYMPGIL